MDIIARQGGVEKIGVELLEASPLFIGKELGGILGRLLRYLGRRHGLDRFVGSRGALEMGFLYGFGGGRFNPTISSLVVQIGTN